jgi:predicted esterase
MTVARALVFAGLVLPVIGIALWLTGLFDPPPYKETRTPSPAPPAAPVLKPDEKPAAPLALSEPPPQPAEFEGKDLRSLPVEELSRLAQVRAGRGDYAAALQCQDWVVRRTGDGRYDLSCYYARRKDIDAALYWLQQAAVEDGVDATHARGDEDLAGPRADPRWRQVSMYLDTCNRWWTQFGKPRTTLVVPDGYDPETDAPLWTVVWLHGYGSHPDGFVDPDLKNSLCRQLANELKLAFVGVSATRPRGRTSFVWSESAEHDLRRIDAALAEVGDRLKVREAGLIALGFSQGGHVGTEVAVRNPARFAGAVAVSPGAVGPSQLGSIREPSPLLKRRGFVLVCGEREHPGTRSRVRGDAQWAESAGARVTVTLFPGQSAHAFPNDFEERFPGWVKFIQAAQGGGPRPGKALK